MSTPTNITPAGELVGIWKMGRRPFADVDVRLPGFGVLRLTVSRGHILLPSLRGEVAVWLEDAPEAAVRRIAEQSAQIACGQGAPRV